MRSSKPLNRARALGAILIWMGLSVAAVVSRGSRAVSLPPWPAVQAISSADGPLRESIAPFWTRDVDATTVLGKLRIDHRASVRRAIAVLETHFDAYRERSAPFAADLLRWSTRGKLAWRSLKDALAGDGTRRRELVRDRFAHVVVDDAELRAAVCEAVERLLLDLRADRARALSRIRARVEVGDSSAREAHDADSLGRACAAIGERMDEQLLRQADRSLVMAVAGLVSATAVTEIVTAAIGASAAGAASGAAGGSIVPGAGTAIGFAAGLGAGIAVDWWMSERVREELTRSSARAIDDLRRRVIDGEQGSRAGLREIFETIAEREAADLESAVSVWLERAP